MDRSEILGKYTMASSVEDLIEVYRPLATEIGADYVAIQIASTDPNRTLENGRKRGPARTEVDSRLVLLPAGHPRSEQISAAKFGRADGAQS